MHSLCFSSCVKFGPVSEFVLFLWCKLEVCANWPYNWNNNFNFFFFRPPSPLKLPESPNWKAEFRELILFKMFFFKSFLMNLGCFLRFFPRFLVFLCIFSTISSRNCQKTCKIVQKWSKIFNF